MRVLISLFEILLPCLCFGTIWLYAGAFFSNLRSADILKAPLLLATASLHAAHVILRTIEYHHPPLTNVIETRTRKRADEPASDLSGTVAEFGTFTSELNKGDIVISSVDSPACILSGADIRQARKARESRLLSIIDMGLPVDPTANTISNVFLHDIDSLKHIVDHNLARRKGEVPKIQGIILEELVQFKAWRDPPQVNPRIQDPREQFEEIRQADVGKHIHRFSSDEHEEIEMLTKESSTKFCILPWST